ncbi:hypothetical protein B566_EDAN018519 [Ephemera danica]|nr:hypothetical protein B566_EDAN018519 [Ephemera danica]
MRGTPVVTVLVVDDSLFVRRTLTKLLESTPSIQVIATAANGIEAIELAHKHNPDVITMDVEMPRMDGLTALTRIMAECPCPVIMISSLTKEGAETTLKALELGALDYTSKVGNSSVPDMDSQDNNLGQKILTLAKRKPFMRLMHQRAKQEAATNGAKQGTSTAVTQGTRAPAPAFAAQGLGKPRSGRPFEAVLIGVSTGGPPAVQKILSALPADFPVPILIAQHMPAAFTGPFAKRLDIQSQITVKEAEGVERLASATAYICPGGKHLRLENRFGTLTGVVTAEPLQALYKPSANVLMETGGLALGRRVLCVMLTGMGSDGLEGTKVLKEKGGYAIAQSESSCVVYGMPKAIVDAGLADEVVDIDHMAETILGFFTR